MRKDVAATIAAITHSMTGDAVRLIPVVNGSLKYKVERWTGVEWVPA